MTRGIYTKWIVGGIVLLIIIAGVCLLWYRHDTAAGRKAAAEAEKVLQQWEAEKQKQKQTITAETETTQTPAESVTSTAEKPINETTGTVSETDTSTDNIQDVLVSTQEMESQKIVPVSPHGFGPFPDVPEDYIIKPFSWDFYKNDPPIHELMARVRIKLWKQGIQTTGIMSSSVTGLVYPTIPGAVFVKKYNRDGADYLEIRGDPDLDLEVIRKELMAGNVPDGIQVLDMDKAGIDPYKFLNLSK